MYFPFLDDVLISQQRRKWNYVIFAINIITFIIIINIIIAIIIIAISIIIIIPTSMATLGLTEYLQ